MSASCSPASQKRRRLAELLASRPPKQHRKGESSIEKIQEAAMHLLSCHQDVNQFLLEVRRIPVVTTKASGRFIQCLYNGSLAYVLYLSIMNHNTDMFLKQVEEPTCKVRDGSICGPLIPEQFIGSTLRDQALHLGIAADVLGAKSAVSAIRHICFVTGDIMEGVLLQPDARGRLTALLKTLKGLLAENCFRRSVFLKEMWNHPHPPLLEVVWHLHNMDIVGLEDVLESCTDASSAVDWFCSEMKSLCLHMEGSSADLEFGEQIISNLLVVLIGRAFCQPLSYGKHSEQSSMTKISLSILNAMLSWLLDAVLKAGNGRTYKPGVERHWLIAYTVSMYRARVILESLENFFLHTLDQTLTYKPELKVSDAIRLQGTWSFAKTCPLLTNLYRNLFVLLNAETLTSHIQRVLDTQEVNWHHVLSFISCLVICQSDSQHLVKDLLSRLLSQAFENYELEYLITAFLIARQAAQEGPAAFRSYTEWFKGTFGAASAYQSTSKKSLVFLLKFLSDLVPFETPQYLKVHILHPPFVPTKFRPLLMEYISLAKTRLADMKVTIEDMGLYEDLSAGSNRDQAQSQAQQDVEKAVQIFENTGKIPASVMEASIFRKPYFTTRFLPALLFPRVLSEVPDSHMLLIDSLKRADKIPASMISAYLDACELEKHRKLEGNEKMEVSLNEGPMAKLQSALWELRPFVTGTKRYDEISSQVAVISDILPSVMATDNLNTVTVASQPLFSWNVEDLEPQQLAASDLILTNFCQCVMAASSTNPPNNQGPWPTLYVKMLFGHRRVLFCVLTRMLQILRHKAPQLKDAHIVGLATFSVHLHECWSSLAPLDFEDTSLDKFWEALLSPLCSESHSVVLRFCTAAISYACCRFSLLTSGKSSNLVPPFFMGKLSFRDWLLLEMSLSPDTDPLSDMERQDYQRWAIHQHFLPESIAAGGCGNDLEKACLIMVEAVLDFNIRINLMASLCHIHNVLGERKVVKATGFQDSVKEFMLPLSLPFAKSTVSQMIRQVVIRAYISKKKNLLFWVTAHSTQASVELLNEEVDLPSLCPSPTSHKERVLHSLDQELVCDYWSKINHVGFLFNVFIQRLSKLSESIETGARLQRQREFAMFCRILLSLPSSLLVLPARGSAASKAENFFHFVNKHLKSISQRGYALPYDITAHFFRGLLGSSTDCEAAEEAVNSVVTAAYSLCPIMLISAVLWWPQLEIAIGCQWKRQFGGGLPKKIRTLKELQEDVDRCLSQGSALSLNDSTWLTAAFLHCTIQRKKMLQKVLTDFLSNINTKSVQLLEYLLFFCIMDLIPLTLKRESAHEVVLESSLQIIQCIEERGGDWLNTFQLSADKDQCPLRQAVSEEFLKLLPIAFFRLTVCLPVESLVRQPNFLSIAMDMYDKLFQLFLDGSPLLHPQQAEPQSVFSRGRQFLLSCIPKCPKPSTGFRSHLTQIVDCWNEKDPELSGLLKNFLEPSQDDYLYDEPDLF
ncbi:Fanconi anemia group A protein [Gastrophryne carolinensis]